ncbi:MAG: SDR family NAD(P)-dependent oxidoreductase [Actinobacteria bacterium]|nr:MAG: SDR family NAD(P)-dependent oxidoreductase [Actinomycetota bacterium]
MRPLDEQTILITGSTDGLGLASAERLARRGAEVLVHGRSEQKLERALAKLGATRGARVRGFLADLSSLERVRSLARDVARSADRIDVLVNNAGVAVMDGRRESQDGFELTFAVNYLSHFLLTAELLPLVRRSAPARIVNVASIGQAEVDLEDLMAEAREYDGFLAYRQSKLAQIMFTFELAERLREGGVDDLTVNALHPATLMDTQMVRGSFGRAMNEVDEGAEALTRLVADPELDGVSGRYFDQLEEGAPHEQAHDSDTRRRLWALSEELVGERFEIEG